MTDHSEIFRFDSLDDQWTKKFKKFRREDGAVVHPGATRRTTLAMLGLAPAGAAVGIESFYNPGQLDDKPLIRGGSGNHTEQIVSALRNLADSIEKQESFAERIDISSALAPNEVLTHALTIRFAYKI